MNPRPFISILVCLLGTTAFAQTTDPRMPVIIDADSTDYDGRTSMVVFTGLRLTQGSISIEADVAQSSRIDFDDSVWRFAGNVVFDVDEGHVTCDSADLEFADFELRVAKIEGSPATFEFKRPDNEESTYAEAARLDYDVAAGTIRFSGGATITEGGNQIRSETLIYSISEQRINASGNGDERVTVTYVPPETDEAADTDTPAPDDSGESDPPPEEAPDADDASQTERGEGPAE